MAQLYLGNDLRHRIFGVDEKPIHFNESGSEAAKTLHFEGAPHCALRTNHSVSRDRLSLMTMVSSWRALCICAKKPRSFCACGQTPAQQLALVVLPPDSEYHLIDRSRGLTVRYDLTPIWTRGSKSGRKRGLRAGATGSSTWTLLRATSAKT